MVTGTGGLQKYTRRYLATTQRKAGPSESGPVLHTADTSTYRSYSTVGASVDNFVTIVTRPSEMKMGAQIRTGKRLPDTGKRFRDRIWAYAQGTQLSALSEFQISIGKSFSGVDLYPHFHFQITVEPPRLIFLLSLSVAPTFKGSFPPRSR